MLVNSENKYSSPAEYFYDPDFDCYFVVDTGLSFSRDDFDLMVSLWESPDLLTEVEV